MPLGPVPWRMTASSSLSLAWTALFALTAAGQIGGAGRFPAQGRVDLIALGASGKLLVGAGDGEIRIWTLKPSHLRHTIKRERRLRCMAVARRGQIIAAGFDDGIELWNAETGKLSKTLAHEDGATYGVALSPNGELLASAHFDPATYHDSTEAVATIRLWNVERDEEIRTLVFDRGTHVFCIAFAPGAENIAAGVVHAKAQRTQRTELRSISVQSGVLDQVVASTKSAVTNLVYSPDGKRLATIGWRYASGIIPYRVREIAAWTIDTGECDWWVETATSLGNVAFSPDGKWLATTSIGSSETRVTIRDSVNGRIRSCDTVGGGATGRVAFSRDGTALLVCSGERLVLLDSTTLAEQGVLWP